MDRPSIFGPAVTSKTPPNGTNFGLTRARSVFRALVRLVTCAASPDGLHAFTLGIDFIQSIPLYNMRSEASYAVFFDRRWPQLNDKLEEKRQRHLRALQDERERPWGSL